jgi:ABC-type cobalamin/Fe3+-siderophores transport system ATPase subunit
VIAPAPLSVSGLSVDLAQGRAALRDVGFRVEPGEFVVVLGPNGAGKTTLLRALAGLAPARGQARFGGDDLMAMRARERARRLARAAGILAQIRIRAPGEATVSEWVHPTRSGVPSMS